MSTRFVLVVLLFCTGVAQSAVLLPFNSTYRFFRGTNEASLPDTTAWRGTNFNDANFNNAPAPFWYGDVRPGGTQLSDMQNNYTCFFLRQTFNLANAAEVGALRLQFFVDDGFILWVNGVEIHRELMPAGEVTRTTLGINQPTDPAPLTTVTAPVSGSLRNGSNVVAIQVFNAGTGSTDIGFDIAIESLTSETVPPTVLSVSPTPGTVTQLSQVTVTFSEPVQGITADDLLVNTQPASGITGGPTAYTFTFAQPLYGNVSFTWFASHGITDTALTLNPFNSTGPGATWQYTLVDTIAPTMTSLFPPSGAVVAALGQIEIAFSEEVTGISAADLVINGSAATNMTRIPGGAYTFQFPEIAPGSVTVEWASGHGITDQAEVPNAFGGGMWSYTVDPDAPPPDLVITEVMASNISGLKDEDGQEEDWIEIYNRGTFAVDLTAWSLSDDPEIPSLWTFGTRLIAPGEYIVVFASGKNRSNPSGTNKFHTNFQLSGGGEFLGLYSADSPRRLVHSFTPAFPEQRNDHSYGYDAMGNLRYFSTPTPGTANGVSTVEAVCSPVEFSVSRGHFTLPFNLYLSTATPGGTIRYTIDGSEPLPTSTTYLGSLRISNTIHIRASAFRNNFLPSRSETHTYFFNQNAAIRSLPVVSIVTSSTNLYGRTGILGMAGGSRSGDGAYITNNAATDYHNPSQHGIAWERPVSVEYILPADNSGFQIDAGIRVQGSDWQRPRTTATSKFSFRLYFRGDYGPGKLDYPLFPLSPVTSYDQVVLRAGFNETGNPFIRDEITRRLSHDMGQVASHGGFFNVFTNGVYAGYYNPCERVHEEVMQAQLGGGGDWDVVGPSFAVSSEGLGIIDGDRNDFNNLVNYVWNLQSSTTITNPAIYNEVARRLDLTNFVDYCLLNAYVAMGDWPANNWRAARERSPTGIWRFVAWDAEWAFGIYELSINRDSFAFTGTGTEDAGLNSTVNSEIARLYQRLRPNPEFRLLWADRIHKHFFNEGALTGGSVSNRFNEMRTELSGLIPSMDTEILVWARDRRGIVMPQFNTYGLYGFSNALYGVFASSNAPVFSQFGGRVPPGYGLTMSAPLGGTIYYTTNGDDPRVRFSGAVSASATAYVSPITMSQSAVVKARTLLDGTNWSAVTAARFDVGTRGIPLRLTEIMYRPVGGSVYEYVELQNVGGAPIDLSGMFFDSSDEGISFTFSAGATLAPGARLVLANDTDPAAFAVRYPGVAVAGYFGGSLNNSGERLTLRDAAGALILTVDYDSAGNWPDAPDTLGASLEIVDPFGDPDDAANWTAAGQPGGTPGTSFTAPPVGDIRLNEIMAKNNGAVNHSGTFPGWIEIYNAGVPTVDLSGWSLTDDNNRRKYVIPATTMLAGNSYLVIWCDAATNTTPGLHSDFVLNGNSDEVFLYDANSNRVDGISFGLQLANYTVGRASGTWALTQPTPNAANASATVAAAASLSINEWLANPLSGQPDWLELYNSASLPVALKNCYLATTTAVHQITSLSFIGAQAHAQFFADEAIGADHLDFKLPAAGGQIILYDGIGGEINRISYAAAVEGVTRGRLPDGGATLTNFVGTASPGASNYVNSYVGAVLNEVLARNQSAVTNAGRVADYIELYNGTGASFPLAGMSLSVGDPQPGQWVFPAGTSLGVGSYLLIWCDDTRPISTAPGDFNIGRALDGKSGGVYLFNAAGQAVNSVEYGFQVPNLSIGLSGGQWRLLAVPTPGAANSALALVGTAASIRINEWMATVDDGPDWFELHNLTNRPVDLSGLFLTDDASTAGQTNHRIASLSFIPAQGFVEWIADADPALGRDHVNFRLNDSADTIRVYSGATVIDSVGFGQQLVGVSQGRLADGSDNIVSFAGSPTPGESNHLPLESVVINELLTHAANPLEDAIELRNTTTQPVGIGGWFLSNRRDNLHKYRVPDGTTLSPGGFAVFYQNQFDNNGTNSFSLDSAHGGEVWLSEADGAGNQSGRRTSAAYGAAASGVSFGRVETAVSVDYVALSARTFGADNPGSLAQFRAGTGAPNAAPRVGPVVIHEVMYNPANGDGAEEFIEIRNTSGGTVQLYDPALPANRWRLTGGINFIFPPNTALTAGAFALVVDFDPADAAAAGAFRGHYGVSPEIAIYGPYSGQLENGGDVVELVRPDSPQPVGNPDAGFIPYIVVDRLAYTDALPWPAGAVDGGGLSLQRRDAAAYGNDPLNWLASLPTAGDHNGSGVQTPPTIIQPPQSLIAQEDASPAFAVTANGDGPLSYQWRQNGINIPGATSPTLQLRYVQLDQIGLYDVVVANGGGSAVSAPASLLVTVPISLLAELPTFYVRPGSNVTFNVIARGTPPLTYQWRHSGTNIPGATSPSLHVGDIQLEDDGIYDVVISNPLETFTASGQIGVLINPVIINGPTYVTVPLGQSVTVGVEITGNPAPFRYEWRRGSVTNYVDISDRRYGFYTLTETNTSSGGAVYRVVVTNPAQQGLTVNRSFRVQALIDTDGDGIPDVNEASYGGGTNNAADAALDLDGDNMSNLDEYIAGTDPTNHLSYLKIEHDFSGESATVRFLAATNRSYSVEYNDALGVSPWLKMADVVPRTNEQVQVVVDPTWTTNRFYRLVTPVRP